MKHKHLAFAVRKLNDDSESLDSNTLSFVASTDRPDRYGDTISQSGWELDAYRANPVVLFQHDHNSLPIGRGMVRQEPQGLMIDVEFDMEDERARVIADKAKRGFLNAVSVGFTPLKAISRANLPKDHYAYSEDGGSFFSKSELLEVSVVTIPANPDATIAAKYMNPEIRDYIHEQIQRYFSEFKPSKLKQVNDDGLYEVAAPEGYHWMNYESGPVLMVGDFEEHEGASEKFAFEIIEEHDPSRLKNKEEDEDLENDMEEGYSDPDSEDEDEKKELERKALLTALLTLGEIHE